MKQERPPRPKQWKLVNGDGQQIYAAGFRGPLRLRPPVDPKGTRKPMLTFDPDSQLSMLKLSRARKELGIKSRWEEIT